MSNKKNINILQIVNDYFGTKLYSLLFNALERKKIKNTIFIPVRSNMQDNTTDNADSRLVVCPCFSTLDRLLYYKKQSAIFNGIKERINLKNIDIVHAHTLFSAGYTSLQLKKKYAIPYIVAVRNVDVNIFFKKVFFLRKTGIKILREAEKIVFLSPAYRDNVLNTYVPKNLVEEIASKCLVIPNGISPIFLKSSNHTHVRPRNNINLIYAGEINKNKNLQLTIKAINILKEQGIKTSFYVIGEVTEPSCKKLLEAHYIQYYQKCSQEQLIEHYRSCDIFVMPSHTETFGLVYAEAMSQGLPIIYTRGQGFDGHFSEGIVGYSVSDKNPVELAEKIKLILNNYEEISSNCIIKAKEFDWDKIADVYLKIYKNIKQ